MSADIWERLIGQCPHCNNSFCLPARYCNSRRPPSVIRSSWNWLNLELVTDLKQDNAKGFMAKYEENEYDLPDDFPDIAISEGKKAD